MALGTDHIMFTVANHQNIIFFHRLTLAPELIERMGDHVRFSASAVIQGRPGPDSKKG